MSAEKNTYTCRTCGVPGHNTRTCPLREDGMSTATDASQSASFGANVPESDPFRATLLKNLDVLMLRLRPADRNLCWAALQTLYADSPSRFVIISSLHQNNADDRLHYSVAVTLTWGTLTFHVYGYWKTLFQITDVTLADNTAEIVTAVSFVKKE